MSHDDLAPCSRCGVPTSIRFGDLPVCEDCHTALASCCAGEFETAPAAKQPGVDNNPEDSADSSCTG